jgi:hypothetical protein
MSVENPPSTKGRRGNAKDTTTHADQVDHGAVEDTGDIASVKPTMGDEESWNADPGDKGYNRTNSRTGQGGTSNRYKK